MSAIGGSAGYYARATAARGQGIQGRDARELGRGERARQFTYGMIGSGVGSLAAGGTALASGGSLAQAGAATLLGQGGSELVGAGSIFSGYGTAAGLAAGAAGGAAVATVDPAYAGLSWQMVGGVPAYVPAGTGAGIVGLGATPAGLAAGTVAAGGGLGSGLLGTLAGAAVTGAANRLAAPPAPKKSGISDGGMSLQDQALANLLGMMGGGGMGDPDRGNTVRDSGMAGGGDGMGLLLLGGLLLAAAA